MFTKSIEHYQNRISLLRARGEEINQNLIKKCQRRIRQLQAEA